MLYDLMAAIISYVSICVVLQNHIDEAMEMYQELHKWDEAIIVAEAKVMNGSYLQLIVFLIVLFCGHIATDLYVLLTVVSYLQVITCDGVHRSL